tara:strand:+ start:61 stop:459 length:399 start_codon:yes stop_codon:yes gene_type:complete
MNGISPKLPLLVNKQDGPYGLNKTLKEAIKQNFKNMILTSPGERVMIPNFGVGLRRYLFSNVNSNLFEALTQRIQTQVDTYMPFIDIIEISFVTSDESSNLSINEIQTNIRYSIPGISLPDTLQITESQNYL